MNEKSSEVSSGMPAAAAGVNPAIKWGWLRALIFLVSTFIISAIMSIVGVVILSAFTNISTAELLKGLKGTQQGASGLGLALLSAFSLAGELLTVWIFRKFIDRKSFVSLGFRLQAYKKDLMAGLAWGIGLITAGFIILLASRSISLTGLHFNPATFFSFLLLFIIVAFNEEIMIRGYVLNNLMTSFNRYAALLISAVIFAVLHLGNPNMSGLAFVNLLLAGLILGIYYIYMRNLWFSIGMHLTWNFFEGPVYGFAVSGMDARGIVQQEVVSNHWLTGGAFGFEGSLVLTVILVISIYLIHRQYVKKAVPAEVAPSISSPSPGITQEPDINNEGNE